MSPPPAPRIQSSTSSVANAFVSVFAAQIGDTTRRMPNALLNSISSYSMQHKQWPATLPKHEVTAIQFNSISLETCLFM